MVIESKLPGSRIIRSDPKSAILEGLNRQKYIKLRIVLDGFPIKTRFKTQEEIEIYFSGDKVQCLLCGRWFKSVGAHLHRVHEVTTREYKIEYGLPLNRGLTSKALSRNLSAIQKVLYNNKINPLCIKKNRMKGVAAAKNTKVDYVVQPFNKNRMSETHKYSSSTKSKYNKRVFLSIIRDAQSNNISLDKAIKKSPIGKTAFYAWKKIYEKHR